MLGWGPDSEKRGPRAGRVAVLLPELGILQGIQVSSEWFVLIFANLPFGSPAPSTYPCCNVPILAEP